MQKSRVKKIARWVLVIALVGIGLVAALGVFYVWQANQARDELASYVASNPDSAAVVAYTVDENGSPVEDGSAVYYNAGQPLVLASTKDHAHRLYLQDGIYAEVTLSYRDREWRPSAWTYPDYRRDDYQRFFTSCRQLLRRLGNAN